MQACEFCGATGEGVGRSHILRLVLGRLITLGGIYCRDCQKKAATCPLEVDGDSLRFKLDQITLEEAEKLLVSP